MGDIEGAVCDACGNRVGPHGCCRDALERESRANAAIYHNGELRQEIETYRKVIAEWKQRAEKAEAQAKWICLVHGTKALPVCGLCIQQLCAPLRHEEGEK